MPCSTLDTTYGTATVTGVTSLITGLDHIVQAEGTTAEEWVLQHFALKAVFWAAGHVLSPSTPSVTCSNKQLYLGTLLLVVALPDEILKPEGVLPQAQGRHRPPGPVSVKQSRLHSCPRDLLTCPALALQPT
eukprot:3940972-Rhodomonas_salina.2